MNVTVVSTVTGCDVTTEQQHHKGSTSTPPRVARLCQIREASLVALRKFHPKKIYACSHVSIIRLVQSTIPVSRDSHSHSSPLHHFPGELVSLSCLLSRVSGMIVQSLSEKLVRKSTQPTRAYNSDSPLNKATIPCPQHSVVKRN